MKCTLDAPPFYQCCCECTERKDLYDMDKDVHKIGYVCVLFINDGAVVTSDKHSVGCECFNDKRNKNKSLFGNLDEKSL